MICKKMTVLMIGMLIPGIIIAGWVGLNTGGIEYLVDIHFPVDPQIGYVLTERASYLKTTDGGSNWSSTGVINDYLLAIHFPVDNQTGFIVGENGLVMKTTNGGANWVQQVPACYEWFTDIFFPTDAQTGYIAGDNGAIMKTTNGGASWSNQNSGTNEHLSSVHFPVNAQTGYVAGNNGTILKTTNGGSTWTGQNSGTNVYLSSIWFPTDNQIGYAVGQVGVIRKTSNGGSSWTSQNSGTTENLASVHFPINAQIGYAVGGGGVIRTTTNGGSTWTGQNSGTNAFLTSVYFPIDAVVGYVAGDSGIVLKTTDGGGNFAITVTTPNGAEVWSVDSTYDIEWTSRNINGNVKIELYKGGGFDRTITGSTDNTGTYSWNIPSSLTPGTDYRIRISSINTPTVYDESDGDFTIGSAGISERNQQEAGIFGLNQSSPNPIRFWTSIDYSLARSCHVELKIYNVSGFAVATLVDETQHAGFHTTYWDIRSICEKTIPSGIYFYQLRTADYTNTKKLIVLR